MNSRTWQLSGWYTAASVLILVCSLVASAAGVFWTGLYRDAPSLLSQLLGQDLLTLFGAVPTLAISLVVARRGSLRGYVVWLGTLGYLLYTYATYAVMTAFNELYLLYVAIFGLTFFTFGGGLYHFPTAPVSRSLGDQTVWPYVALEVTVALLVGALWLSDIIGATFSGGTPSVLAGTGLPAPVIQSIDLAVLLPALLVTAVWLWRGRPWGLPITGVLLVKIATLGLAVLAMAVVQMRAGQEVAPPMLVIFGLITLTSLALAIRFVAGIDEQAAQT